MEIGRFRKERAFRLPSREEEGGGAVFDDFCGSVGGALVGIATMSAVEGDFLGEDGATDGKLVTTDVTIKANSILAVSAGVDSVAGDQPSIEISDVLINLDVVFGDEDDLGSEVSGEDTVRL